MNTVEKRVAGREPKPSKSLVGLTFHHRDRDCSEARQRFIDVTPTEPSQLTEFVSFNPSADPPVQPHECGGPFANQPRRLPAAMTDETYNEEAFQYFLDVEERRSERSSRPFLLLLADLNGRPGTSLRMDPDVAAKLFSG